MSQSNQSKRGVKFGAFETDLVARELRKSGVKIRLQYQPFVVLALLLEKCGQVVTREELRQRLWPADTFVDFDNGLNNAIKRLREALCDSSETPRYIETLPRRGYRFIAPISEIEDVVPQDRSANQPAEIVPGAARRWVVRVGVVIVIFALGTTTYVMRHMLWPAPKVELKRTMLAVLPFENLSGDPQQEYFSDGLTEEMIAQVSRLNPERLGVIARTSAMQYKGTTKNVTQIGRELGVSYVLESSVRREGNRVRITAQLVRVSDQTHVWSQEYEREVRETLPLESEVTQAIAREIEIRLSAQEAARRERARPVDPDAYQLYLKGRYFWNKRTQEGFWKGIEYFNEAIEKDPSYAQAYVGLADSYILLGPNDILPAREVYPLAKSASIKALELDDMLAEAHASLGFVKLLYDWNPTESEQEFRRAIELDANYPTAHHWYAYDLAAMGRLDDALLEIRRAVELDPLSIIINADVAQLLFFAHRYDEALAQCQTTIDLDPAPNSVYWYQGLIYEQQGMSEQAVQAFSKDPVLMQIDPDEASAIGALKHASGPKEYWQSRLALLQTRSKKHYVSPFSVAVVYARMDDKDKALEYLEKAYAERYPSMVFLGVEPVFDSVRADPRFGDLLRRIKLASHHSS